MSEGPPLHDLEDTPLDDDTQPTQVEPEPQDATAATEPGLEGTMDVDARAHRDGAMKDKSETGKRKTKGPPNLARVPGKSLFPIARVQRILKADKELPTVSREAVMLIALATEEFVLRIAEASHRIAVREGRATAQRKDIASVCRRADEFFFLEELIPLYEPPAPAPVPRKPKERREKGAGSKLLEQFIIRADAEPDLEPAQAEDGDIVMDEDGTMTLDSL